MAEMKGRFTLYYFPMSYYSQKAVHALYEKKIPFKQYFINIHDGDQHELWYRKVNPKGLVPVLQDVDAFISESEDIIDYIDKVCTSGPRLVPDPATSLGKEVQELRKLLHDIPIDRITFGVLANQELTSEPNKLPFKISRESITKRFEDSCAKRRERLSKIPELKEGIEEQERWSESFRTDILNKEKIDQVLGDQEKVFDALESQLQKTIAAHKGAAHSDLWLFGSEVTAADITATTLLNRVDMLGLIGRFCPEDKRPLVLDYFKRVNERQAVKQTVAEFKYVPRIYIKSKIKSMLPKFGLVFTAGLAVVAGYVAYNKYK